MKKFYLKTILICVLMAKVVNAQCQSKPGLWAGFAKQDNITYRYQVNINKVVKDSIWGTTVSRSNNFYSETKFKGIATGDQVIILESEILKTNYKGAGSICLLTLILKKNKNKLQGRFIPVNDIKNCGSGSIFLELVTVKKDTSIHSKGSNKSVIEDIQNHPPKMTLVKIDESPKKVTAVQQPNIHVALRKIDKRDVEVLNTFRFKEDSVMIKIFDNGVIDGDVITLIINGTIVFDKIKLSTSPITYSLKSNTASQFQIEFYADTLGDIPPNTGLISISSSSKTSEALFLSDLKKTSAIKLILNNIY